MVAFVAEALEGQNHVRILIALSCLLTLGWFYEDTDNVATASLGKVTVTTYQAVESQTDGNPFITADGTDLREADERICALSQDFMWFGGGLVQWGNAVWLYVPDHPELTGYWVVRDTMALTVYRNGVEVPLVRHVDLLTKEYGRWTGYALLIRRGIP